MNSGFIAPSVASLKVPKTIVSDTGEITRDARNGRWTLNAPRAHSWVGSWSGRRLQLGSVDARFAPGDAWHTGSLVSMDGAELPKSKQMLLVLAGRAENVGMGGIPRAIRSATVGEAAPRTFAFRRRRLSYCPITI
jgi:hypothetical protein